MELKMKLTLEWRMKYVFVIEEALWRMENKQESMWKVSLSLLRADRLVLKKLQNCDFVLFQIRLIFVPSVNLSQIQWNPSLMN